MHIQFPITKWPQGLTPGVRQGVVAADYGSIFKEVKTINPQAFTALRHVNDPLQKIPSDWEEALRLAEQWWASFVDDTFEHDMAAYTDAVIGYNEMYADSQTDWERAHVVMVDQALAVVWNERYRPRYPHIRPIIGNAAVGNRMPPELAQVCVQENAIMGYHPYLYVENKVRPDWEKDALSGLWMLMDQGFTYKPDWFYTEGGVYKACNAGWKDRECLDGDLEMYARYMATQIREIKATPAYAEGRVIAAPVWFTSGSTDFSSFELNGDQLAVMARMLAEEWPRDDPHPIPPEIRQLLWDRSVQEQTDCGIRFNEEAGLQNAILDKGLYPVISEFKVPTGQTEYLIQAGELPNGYRALYAWIGGEAVLVMERK